MKRYIIAILISALGVFASHHYLKPNEWGGSRKKSDKPLAKLSKVVNDVKKKAKGKMIWTSIMDDAQLYQGEMVRTAKDSSAVLEFLETGSTIELEPDSTVLIEMMKKNVSLDVLSGGLFVKSVEKDGRSISLKSGKKTVDLSNGDLSFSVGEKGEVGVQVHRGKVSANIGGKNVTLSDKDIGTLTDKGIDKEENKFIDVRPALAEKIYLEPKQEKKIARFQWKPLEAGYSISLKIGSDRRQLEKIKMNKIVPGESGKLLAVVKLGTYYWQLEADPVKEGLKSFKSIIYKNDFLMKIPPIPLGPTDQETVYLAKPGRPFKFEWSTPAPLSQTIVEISKEEDFKKIILQYTLGDKNNLTINDMAAQGTYFWRVRGTLKDSNTRVESDIRQFILKFGEELRPPVLLSPSQNQKIFLEGRGDKPVYFTWKNKKDIIRYKFFLRGLGERAGFKLEKDRDTTQIGIKNMKPGIYSWSVASVRKDGKTSEFSEEQRVNVMANMPELNWLSGAGKHQYVGERQNVKLSWNKGPVEAIAWKVKIADNKDLKDFQLQELNNTQSLYRPNADGIYYAKVFAYDKDETIIAKSTLLSFEVSQMPLPNPPEFDDQIKNPIVSNKSGKLQIAFKPDKNVDKYMVEVKDLNGNIIQQVRIQQRQGTISSLMPGQYWITGRSIDRYGRMGPAGESRKLMVPQESGITAPTVDKIIIK